MVPTGASIFPIILGSAGNTYTENIYTENIYTVNIYTLKRNRTTSPSCTT